MNAAALVRLIVSALAVVRRCLTFECRGRDNRGMVFEGAVLLVKEVAPPGDDHAREVVITFKVLRPADVPGPKFVVVQTSVSEGLRLDAGTCYEVRAEPAYETPVNELAAGVVTSLRDAKIELVPLLACASAAA